MHYGRRRSKSIIRLVSGGWPSNRATSGDKPTAYYSDAAITSHSSEVRSMGRMYCINLTATAFTVAADLVEITPADDKPVIIHGFRVWQTTELGDTAEEVIPIGWVRGNATSGSVGNTSVAATPKNP